MFLDEFDHIIKISIHALREEGDVQLSGFSPLTANFYPRPPRGGRRLCPSGWQSCPGYFYPRPPRGGRHAKRGSARPSLSHFYPRPPRGGRPGQFRAVYTKKAISIHALREEGDS